MKPLITQRTLETIDAHTTYIEDAMTTPPLPSSSPAPPMDVMEMSPLPHKPSFIVSRDSHMKTPTVNCSPMMDSPSASGAPSPLQDSPMLQKENLIE